MWDQIGVLDFLEFGEFFDEGAIDVDGITFLFEVVDGIFDGPAMFFDEIV